MKAKPDMHAFVRYINPVILAHALVHCRWDEMSGIFECAVWQPYLQSIAYKTQIYARMCLLGVSMMNNHTEVSKVPQSPRCGA